MYRSADGRWQEEAQLTPGVRDVFIQQVRRFEGQRFGTSVAVGKGPLPLERWGTPPRSLGGIPARVYLFEYDGRSWVETAKLTPDSLDQDPAQTEESPSICSRMRLRSFGALVALDRETLAVGGDAEGRVYIYQRGENGWLEQARLPIPGSSGSDFYMASLALFEDTLALSAFYVVSQPEPAEFLTGQVSVYVFERAGEAWEESFRFNPEGEEVDFLFLREVNVGAFVALGGFSGQANLLAVGLPGFPD